MYRDCQDDIPFLYSKTLITCFAYTYESKMRHNEKNSNHYLNHPIYARS
jgi:hypothetical protein